MKLSKLIIVLATACSVAALPFAARADDEADAKAAYKKGREHYKAGRFAEAIVELQKAYSLKPHPALLRYMGDTYFKMNDAKKAIEHYKKYLNEAPQAADRQKVESKVRQLELIVGASDEEEEPEAAPPPPPPEPAPAPPPEPAPSPKKIEMAPTGEDKEVPVALKHRTLRETPRRTQPREEGSALTPLKWVALGVAVATLTTGIIANRVAAGAASDLEKAVKEQCPDTDPNCGGNPEMNNPKVRFSESHFDLQQEYKKFNTVSIAMFITAGVTAATAAILFIVDKPKKRRAGRRVGLAPVLGGGTYGLAGEVTF